MEIHCRNDVNHSMSDRYLIFTSAKTSYICHFDITLTSAFRRWADMATDVELISIRCSSAIWETCYDMESFIPTNNGIGQLEVTMRNMDIFKETSLTFTTNFQLVHWNISLKSPSITNIRTEWKPTLSTAVLEVVSFGADVAWCISLSDDIILAYCIWWLHWGWGNVSPFLVMRPK